MGLIQECQQADAERQREVKQLQDEVTAMLKEFNEAHSIMSSELRNSLTKGVTKRRSEVANMITDFAQRDTERRSEVTEYIQAEVGKIHSDVAAIAQEATAIVEAADNFVKDLGKSSAERRSEVANMLTDFAQRDTERRSEVASIHEMVWGKAPTKRKVSPLVKKLPEETPAENTMVKTAPARELRDKVFVYLANHPDGTRLTELEEEFSVARIQTARVIRELMDGNKVEKRDLLYFTI